MPRAVAFFAAVALIVLCLSACDNKTGPFQQASGSAPGARQVTVVGVGQVTGTPDTLTANVAIEFTAPDVTGAMNQTNDRQQAVINALANAGIDRKDISTTAVTLQPQFAGPENAITGYRAANTIDVRIPANAASQALSLIVTTGGDATRINSVAFSIDDNAQLVRDARSRAFDDAKARAQQYAQMSGLKLGKIISISESGAPNTPTPMPMPHATAAVPLEPGQQKVGFSVTVVWELT
jgi:uncharacterized protein